MQDNTTDLNMDEKISLLESKRKKAMIFNILMIIPFVVAFITMFITIFGDSFGDSPIILIVLGISILLFCILGGFAYKFFNDYKKYYKQNFVKLALEGMFDDLVYEPKNCISKSIIESAHIIRRGNTFSGDDFISASYHGVPFVHSDITIQQVTSNGKNTTTTTYFKGKWMSFDFNKDFSEYVIIAEKKGGAIIDKKTNNKVEMESVEFNNKFRVFATDDHTAFYLITPQFFTNLEKLRDNTKGQLLLAFVDGKLHVALHTNKNSLEPKIFSRVDTKVINSIRDELKVITDFLDALAVDKPNFRTDKIDAPSSAPTADPFIL